MPVCPALGRWSSGLPSPQSEFEASPAHLRHCLRKEEDTRPGKERNEENGWGPWQGEAEMYVWPGNFSEISLRIKFVSLLLINMFIGKGGGAGRGGVTWGRKTQTDRNVSWRRCLCQTWPQTYSTPWKLLQCQGPHWLLQPPWPIGVLTASHRNFWVHIHLQTSMTTRHVFPCAEDRPMCCHLLCGLKETRKIKVPPNGSLEEWTQMLWLSHSFIGGIISS